MWSCDHSLAKTRLEIGAMILQVLQILDLPGYLASGPFRLPGLWTFQAAWPLNLPGCLASKPSRLPGFWTFQVTWPLNLPGCLASDPSRLPVLLTFHVTWPSGFTWFSGLWTFCVKLLQVEELLVSCKAFKHQII